MPVATALTTHDIEALFRLPRQGEEMLISAHRGLRWDGVPENSKEAILAAARMGLTCIEVDIRMTSDGHPVVLHDENLGRATSIGEYLGSEPYNPWTARGTNPAVNSVPWSTTRELFLKTEHGMVTEAKVLDFEAMLAFVRDQALEVVLFLDVKEGAALPIAAEIVGRYANARGTPAAQWCVWKLDTEFYATPREVEDEAWFQTLLRKGDGAGYIPVFEPGSHTFMDVLPAAKAWMARSYCWGLEVGLRSPGGALSELVNWGREQGVSMGFFAALGDVHPDDGMPMLMSTGDVDLDLDSSRSVTVSPTYFKEGEVPCTYDSRMTTDWAPDGRDARCDLDTYRKMGYSWAICDLTNRSAALFAAQAAVQAPLEGEWARSRIDRVCNPSE